MHNLQTLLKSLASVAAAVSVAAVSLTGCSSGMETSAPTLNLVTGCFSTVETEGEPYIYVGCLNSAELASLADITANAPLAKLTIAAREEFAHIAKAQPYQPATPVLNLETGCVYPSDKHNRAYQALSCLSVDALSVEKFSAEVGRKIGLVKQAYSKVQEATWRGRPDTYETPVSSSGWAHTS